MTIGGKSTMNQILPTSTVGSLPKPSWLARPETLWAPWKLQGDELVEGKQDALRIAAKEQSDRGIDIVSDGEQTRQHFVTTFIEHLDGVDFEQRETVRIRNRYDASVPTVVGAVSRSKPVFVDDARFLRQQTDQPIKWALPGPMTMIDTLYDGYYQSREKLAWEFATILNQEARDLEAAGVDIIQFDEPAFNVYFDEMKDWGVATLERATEGLRAETAVHICYGYGIKANTDWKATLGSEWRQYEESFPSCSSPASTSSRWNATTPMSRSTSSNSSGARRSCSVPSTWRTRRSRLRRKSPPLSGTLSGSSTRTSFCRARIAAWRPSPGTLHWRS